ncbi:MAG: pyocin activator PrtN family protein [bacterium]|nr:pyocin activator PrtN family protein [bacterium]
MNKRALLLMIEFEAADIQLEKVAPKYLNMSERQWKLAARQQALPFPVFRVGSQKSPWLVNVLRLAEHVDKIEAEARADWKAA